MAAGAILAPLIIPITHPLTRKSKNHIDTKTPISIQSDSAGVLIFFTLDGSKPVAGQRGSDGSSRKYTDPILLPAGQVTVRAMAVTRDGRESSVVTKGFSVDQVETGISDDSRDGLQKKTQQQPIGTLGSIEHFAGSAQRPAGPCFLNGRFGSRGSKIKATALLMGSSRRSRSADSRHQEQLSKTQWSEVQRDKDFPWCPRCLSARPPDPFARFCPQCGSVIPPVTAPKPSPAETGQVMQPSTILLREAAESLSKCVWSGQMLRCASCQSLVPVNTQTCLICETSTDRSQQPLLSLQGHALCPSCGSWNPAKLSSCVTCESRLQPVNQGHNSAPSRQAADDRMFSCSRCERLNRGDARFCDWCGIKLRNTISCVSCWQCGASAHPGALFCTSCGVFLDQHSPSKPCNDTTPTAEVTTYSQVSALTQNDAAQKAMPPSISAPRLKVGPPSVDQATQTVGLYFPSSMALQKKEQQRAIQHTQELANRDRRPPLTAISPGRGYWRKQLDHVCAHLRSYTQNHSSFRTLLAEPRLGQMISAVIQEDQQEVILTLSFSCVAPEQQQVGLHGNIDGPVQGGSGIPSQAQTLSHVTEQSTVRTSLGSRLLSGLRRPNRNLKPGPSVTDCQLLKELGPDRGRIATIQHLLDQGADPSCCGSDSRHALAVAVVNSHYDVLPVLIQRGADVDQQSGPMRNTALHEAAAMGSEGLQSAKLLLRCKASVRRRNAAGQTAYDMAVTSGCDDMMSLLAAQTGLDLLGRSHQNLDII
ncbi:LOW QUALITY PROTEIN: double zinc ribbon and ankyrin repeat-containing protein 1 [Cyprinodon tularosa]|uniref:LOW QUALITY PROTEIN: double zinc ribbon and ankyrin repeat-containing protein 1 n=1 Tax=Cyprinodon tularosa TaxID=77115 RepID=UPI0018E22DD7|nr:LOW QUALITY PROTEIN: double zinc ribbon and ankyrin repeat-containing protein 1 [Cyprinodon tularosa]